jgi:predicted 3-demethylubiquinone-9 3-methyltransferase (glyoxalase superfamily)
MTAQRITTSLWFDREAEEAANFYVSIFRNSKILDVARFGDGGMGQSGTVMTVSFQLEGQRFLALNGSPHEFNEATSLLVDCKTQAEVDELWERLTADGGAPGRCGWLKDRYGLSWQIVPSALPELMHSVDPARSRRVMEAMLQMGKLDIAALEKAYHQG